MAVWRGGVMAAALAMAAMGRAQDTGLQSQVEAIAKAHHGKVALFAEQVGGGKSVAIDADKPVQTASIIKLAILYHAMVEVREGRAHWDEKILLKQGEAVGGSGMLHFFDAPMNLTLKDVLTMMVIVSDNTATNLAIERFGVGPVNARVEALGLKNTHLYKRIGKPALEPMPEDQPKFGLGKSTPREMAQLMETIGECKLRRDVQGKLLPMDEADKAVCAVGLEMLKAQFYRETVPRYLPGGGDQSVASKTGSLNHVRGDEALVEGKSGPMVLSIFTYDNDDASWTVDNEGEMTIAKLAKAIVTAWSPEGLDEKKWCRGWG
ncbi:serine hydrolase [Granulicella cerasi]|uniref:Serine hydrolase n=1 Tax=Granulicella cerasi TaxID=741063 RepID=A0ABW1ZD69_9BACT